MGKYPVGKIASAIFYGQLSNVKMSFEQIFIRQNSSCQMLMDIGQMSNGQNILHVLQPLFYKSTFTFSSSDFFVYSTNKCQISWTKLNKGAEVDIFTYFTARKDLMTP